MAKNNKQDFMGCDTAGYKDIKLLDIQPLHPGMTVMVVDTDGNDNIVMRDCVETAIVLPWWKKTVKGLCIRLHCLRFTASMCGPL